jgi:hypothetical protein
MNPYSDLSRNRECSDRLLHRQGRLASQKRMRLLRSRRTENDVQSIAKGMENGSPEVLRCAHHCFNGGLEAPPGRFRIEVCYQARRTNYVCKQCRGLLTLTLLLHERRDVQLNSAVNAEPVASTVFVMAVATLHFNLAKVEP